MDIKGMFINASKNIVDKTTEAYSNVKDEIDEEKQKIDGDSRKQRKLKDIFTSSRDLGDISIDLQNRLFRIRNVSEKDTKRNNALSHPGKAALALSTAGTSIASEISMKADDRIFRFSQLKGYELMEDETVIDSGGALDKASKDSVLVKSTKFVANLAGKKKNRAEIESLMLKVFLDDIYFTEIGVPYIQSHTRVASGLYSSSVNLAHQTMSSLDLIIEDEKTREPALEQRPDLSDPVEQLKRLKELLDMNIINEEEFEIKKKEILGL